MASTKEPTKEPSNEQYSQLEVAPPDLRDETQPKFIDLRESNQKFIVADSGRQEYKDGPFESTNAHRRFRRRKWVWLGVIAVVVIAAVVGGAVGGTEAKNNGKPRWDSSSTNLFSRSDS